MADASEGSDPNLTLDRFHLSNPAIRGFGEERMKPRLSAILAFALAFLAATVAEAQIRIGAILSISGPGAAMGVGYKGAFDFLPQEVAGQKIEYIIRDDATDAENAFKIGQKLISEDRVDALIGPSLYTSDIAVQPLANAAHVPMIAMAPLIPEPAKFPYSFAVAQPLPLMVSVVFKYMHAHGIRTVGFIGFSDGWGDQVHAAALAAAKTEGIGIIADERYARTDTTVQAQALRLMAARPDAVMMGNSATPAVLPVAALRRLGYRGGIYGNHGIVSPAFIRVGGAAMEGVIADTSPVAVYEQLADDNPIKPVATAFMAAYTKKFGPASVNPFAGYSYDAMLLIAHAIPAALAHGKPGTEAFRAALRDAIEQTHELVGVSGIYNMSPTDHNGQDARAAVLVEVHKGTWTAIR
jgi:branched-chain amino acid transport system substrate-binding protein